MNTQDSPNPSTAEENPQPPPPTSSAQVSESQIGETAPLPWGFFYTVVPIISAIIAAWLHVRSVPPCSGVLCGLNGLDDTFWALLLGAGLGWGAVALAKDSSDERNRG